MTVTEVYDKIRIGYKVEDNVPTSYEIQNKMIELDDKIREKLSRYILHSEENNHFFVSFIYHTGSNGAEGSIKNSLLEVYEILNDIETWGHVKHVLVEDISIDVLDDVYDFLITIEID